MKFQVREGFVVKTVAQLEVNGQNQIQENNYFGGQVVDLDAATATDHAHKLEPADKAATAHLEGMCTPPSPVPSAMADVDVQAIVQAAVTAALAAVASPAVNLKAPA